MHLFVVFVTPLGFKPKTFRTFSDLIQLIKKVHKGTSFMHLFVVFVTPLGFKPKTFRTGI